LAAPALPDLADAAADEAVREAARVAVRVVFSAALAERFATLLAARVCLRTCFVFSLAALLTASLTPLPEALELRDRLLPREEEPDGRMASAAAGLTMPIMLAADSITPVATFEAWSTTSLVTLAAWFKASPATSMVASTGPRPPRPFLLAIAYLFFSFRFYLPLFFITVCPLYHRFTIHECAPLEIGKELNCRRELMIEPLYAR
jgi:hypothetical protein